MTQAHMLRKGDYHIMTKLSCFAQIFNAKESSHHPRKNSYKIVSYLLYKNHNEYQNNLIGGSK